MMRIREIAIFLLLLPGFEASAACDFIAADNKRLDQKLTSLETKLQLLNTELAAMETACQKEQQQIAGSGGDSATGDSCIALGEAEAMNRKLNSSSVSCAARHTAMRKTIDLFRSSSMEPFRDSMLQIRKMHGMVEPVLPACRAEFRASREMGDRSQAALKRAEESVAKAQDDIKNFNRVAGESGRVADSTGQARARCVSEEAGDGAPLALARESGKQPPAAVKAGKSRPGASTVTGEADKIHYAPMSSRTMLAGNPIGKGEAVRSGASRVAEASGAQEDRKDGPGATGALRGDSQVTAPGAGRAPAAAVRSDARGSGAVEVAWTDSGSAAMQVQSFLSQASAGIAGSEGEATGASGGAGAVLFALVGEAGRQPGEATPGAAAEEMQALAANANGAGSGDSLSQAEAAGLSSELSLFERVHRVLRSSQARL